MSKPKFASLTAGLLARKGEATPTAQPFASLVPALAPPPEPDPAPRRSWSGDLSSLIQRANPPAHLREIPRPQAAPMPQEPVAATANVPALPPAPEKTLRPAERVSIFARPMLRPAEPPAMQDPAASHRRHGVTVRLDGPRYRRLMVVSMRYGRTYQDILARALDVYMTALGIEDPGDPAASGPRKSR